MHNIDTNTPVRNDVESMVTSDDGQVRLNTGSALVVSSANSARCRVRNARQMLSFSLARALALDVEVSIPNTGRMFVREARF